MATKLERTSKHVRELIGRRGSVLADLAKENERRLALDALLGRFLDRPFKDHVQVAHAQGGQLVLCADSPAWGHRVRYLAPAILDHFVANGLPELRQVAIRVRQPDAAAPSPAPPRPARISARSAELLRRAADAQSDPQLARRLRAIARTREGEPRDD